MSPALALRAALFCAALYPDEPTPRTAARLALALTGRDARQGVALRKSLVSCLFTGRRTGLDVGAALQGGFRDDGGDLVLGGTS